MSDINVIFAVNETTWGLLKQNFQRDEDGKRLRADLTPSQAAKLKTNIHGHWKTPTLGGTVYHIVSWYVPNIPTVEGGNDLKWLEFLLTEFPGKFHVIGAWNKDGSQFGTEIAHYENGTDSYEVPEKVVTLVDKEVIDEAATIASGVLTMKTIQVEEIHDIGSGVFEDIPHYDEVVQGTHMYPIHAQYLKIFPDDVTYDEDGNETSRTAAVAPKEVNNILGWKPRRWT